MSTAPRSCTPSSTTPALPGPENRWPLSGLRARGRPRSSKSLGEITGEVLVNGTKPDVFFKRRHHHDGAHPHYDRARDADVRRRVPHAPQLDPRGARRPRRRGHRRARAHQRPEHARRRRAHSRLLVGREEAHRSRRVDDCPPAHVLPRRAHLGSGRLWRPLHHGARAQVRQVGERVRRHCHPPAFRGRLQPLRQHHAALRGPHVLLRPRRRRRALLQHDGLPDAEAAESHRHYLDVISANTQAAATYYDKSPLACANLAELNRLKSQTYSPVRHIVERQCNPSTS